MTCRCGDELVPVVHITTDVWSDDVVACCHCDQPCTKSRCLGCRRLSKKVTPE